MHIDKDIKNPSILLISKSNTDKDQFFNKLIINKPPRNTNPNNKHLYYNIQSKYTSFEYDDIFKKDIIITFFDSIVGEFIYMICFNIKKFKKTNGKYFTFHLFSLKNIDYNIAELDFDYVKIKRIAHDIYKVFAINLDEDNYEYLSKQCIDNLSIIYDKINISYLKNVSSFGEFELFEIIKRLIFSEKQLNDKKAIKISIYVSEQIVFIQKLQLLDFVDRCSKIKDDNDLTIINNKYPEDIEEEKKENKDANKESSLDEKTNINE